MNTVNQNVVEIVDAFETYVNTGEFKNLKRNDKFLRYILDRSATPSFQGRKRVEETPNGEKTSMDYSDKFLTAEQEAELAQIQEMMNASSGRWGLAHGEDVISCEVLRERLLTIPPVYAQQLLIIGIMIYALRTLEAEFDSETAAFNEFFLNWHSLIVYRG